MSGSIDTSDILVVIDKGDELTVNLQPPDEYGISIKSGDTYVVNIDLPTIINTQQTGNYLRVAEVAYTALTASYVSGGLNSWDTILNKPSGLVSSSTQVDYNQIQNKPAAVQTASYVEYNNVGNKPSLVSSSTQITQYNIFATTGSNTFTGNQIISGGITFVDNTTQTTAFTGIPTGTVSSSQQVVDAISNQIISPTKITTTEINVSTNNPQFSTTISSSIKSGIYAATEVINPPMSVTQYSGAVIEYVAQRSSGLRTGMLYASWSGSTISYTDVSNADVGDTTDLSFNFIKVDNDILLRAYSLGTGIGDWTVQVLFKMFPNLL